MSRRVAIAALLLMGACGGKPKVPASKPAGIAVEPSVSVLTRASLNQVLDAGLGAALQHVSLAELPVTRGGQVYGYQVLTHDEASIWGLFDVRPGDILVALNNGPLGTPDQAQASFEALRGAPEVSLRIERAGRTLELRQTVHGSAK